MPEEVFFNLNEEKKERIINAAMIEFATYGYENSSTNRIIKECGISKGSLFKYFKSKEELYFYLIEIIFAEMSKEMEIWITKISKGDIWQRVIDFCTLEMLWYIENPIKGSFVIKATSDSNTKIFKKLHKRFAKDARNVYFQFLLDVDMDNKKEVADVIKWVIDGYNMDFRKTINLNERSLEEIKNDYMEGFTKYIQILQKGF
jgi:AcrR family transcriptional regulator